MLNVDSYTPAQVILKLKPDLSLDSEDEDVGTGTGQTTSNLNGNSITFKSLQRVGDHLTPMSQEFTFDKIITETDSTQQEIDDLITHPVIDDLLQGISTVVMTYGQTESGKTYTLFGNNDTHSKQLHGSSGSGFKPMVSNLCETLYSRLPQDKTCHVSLSCIQIEGAKYYDSLDREYSSGSSSSSSSLKKLQDRREYPMFSLDDLLGSIHRVYSSERGPNGRRHILIRISLQIIDTRMDYIQRSQLTVLDLTESVNTTSKDKLLHSLERVVESLTIDGRSVNSNNLVTTTLESFTSPSDTVSAVITTKRSSTVPPVPVPLQQSSFTNETSSVLTHALSNPNSNSSTLNDGHLLPKDTKLHPVLSETLASKNKVILLLTASMQPVNSQQTLKTLTFGSKFKCLRSRLCIDKRPLDMENELLQLHKDFEIRCEYWKHQREVLESELDLVSSNTPPLYTDEESKLDLKLQLKEDETLNLQNQINSLKNLLLNSTTLSLDTHAEVIFDLLDALSNKIANQYIVKRDLDEVKLETDILSSLLMKKTEHIEYLDSLNADLRRTIEEQEDFYRSLMETNINLNVQLQELNERVAMSRRQIDTIVKRSAATGCLNGLYSPFHQYIVGSSLDNKQRGSLSSNDSRSSASSSLWTNPELPELDDFNSSDRSYRTQLTAASPHSVHVLGSGTGFKPRGGFQLNVVKATN